MPKHPLYSTFTKSIIDARLEAGLTQSEVSLRLGKPQSYVSKYESGERRLDVIEFLEICQAIGVQPEKIIKKLGGLL
jgi:transcriptional regulator with XRE-family HTH domain